MNIPVTNPLDKDVIKEYSIGKRRGMDRIISAVYVDFFLNVKSEIRTYGNNVIVLVIMGSALCIGTPISYNGIANNDSSIVL